MGQNSTEVAYQFGQMGSIFNDTANSNETITISNTTGTGNNAIKLLSGEGETEPIE